MRPIQCLSCSKYTPSDRAECLSCGAALYPVAPPVVEVPDSPSEFVSPKCKSPHITGIKKGFGLGKALVGGVLTGGVGLLAGFIGSRKVAVTCMQCGHSWDAGKH